MPSAVSHPGSRAFNEWDFRIPVGELRLMGLDLLLVNDPAAVRQVMVTGVDQFPNHLFTLWMLEPLIGRCPMRALVTVSPWVIQRHEQLRNPPLDSRCVSALWPGAA